jgi:hypothetical protein
MLEEKRTGRLGDTAKLETMAGGKWKLVLGFRINHSVLYWQLFTDHRLLMSN